MNVSSGPISAFTGEHYQPCPSPVPSTNSGGVPGSGSVSGGSIYQGHSSNNSSNTNLSNQNPHQLRNLESAFPPFIPGVQLRSVYERAGFDVNRGGGKHHRKKDRSRKTSAADESGSSGSSSAGGDGQERMNSSSSGDDSSSRASSRTKNYLGLTTNTAAANGAAHANSPSPTPTFSSGFGGHSFQHSKQDSMSSANSKRISPTTQQRFLGNHHATGNLSSPPTPTIPEYSPSEQHYQGHQPNHYYHQNDDLKLTTNNNDYNDSKPRQISLPKIEVLPQQQDYPTPPSSSMNTQFNPNQNLQQYPSSSLTSQLEHDIRQNSNSNSHFDFGQDDVQMHGADQGQEEAEYDHYQNQLAYPNDRLAPGNDDDRLSRASVASSVYSFTKDPILDSSPSLSGTASREFGGAPSSTPPLEFEKQLPSSQHENQLYHQHSNSTSTNSSASTTKQSLYSGHTLSSPTSPIDSSVESPQISTPKGTGDNCGKKCCRGCGETIIGKCVSTKDGTIPGKWHRACFVCHRCESPFQSAEFYVYGEWPYCNGCFHIENNSVCNGCGVGIEGECLETIGSDESLPVRYHMYCLACAECGSPITDEYYYDPSRGTTLCSTHASDYYPQGDNRTSRLEKRRTRLLVV